MSAYYLRKVIKDALSKITVCAYCGNYANTVDHIHPQVKGGDSSILNLTKACVKCNGYKSEFSIDVFLGRMIEKRETGLNKFYSYSGRYRRHKKRNTQPDLQVWFLAKMEEIRISHKYFSSVIGSILNKKYILFKPCLACGHADTNSCGDKFTCSLCDFKNDYDLNPILN